MLARLEALENDNAGMEMVQNDDDDEASLDEDDQGQLCFFLHICFFFFPCSGIFGVCIYVSVEMNLSPACSAHSVNPVLNFLLRVNITCIILTLTLQGPHQIFVNSVILISF